MQKKYPNLTNILKNIEKTTKNDIKTWRTFKQTLGLTDEQASEILQWGEGPKVKIKYLGDLFGNNLALFGITKNKRNIVINKQLIKIIEGKEKSFISKDEIVFAIYVTLLHEAQHHAEFKYRITKFDPYNENDPNHEAGLSFELNAFKGIGVFNKHEQINSSIKTFREILFSKNKFEIKRIHHTNKEQKGRKFQIIFSNYNILEELNVK
ncbi:MAG: hypothetical protein KatS3mg035_2037 [Bacteroidia bacterium]|nr:MAG: hypothetical protein KatS3mg035_2037 [Bacteroidia bacterium]